ncbi:hypothetical protein KKF84_05335 [Myxococcota bacterium]|nr:hypothetical protein [Myxococcota bacterium]MBU1534721.1 hypothetical protein [Myxococcota bacterium]
MIRHFHFLPLIMLLLTLGACSDGSSQCDASDPECSNVPKENVVLLYGSPTCGICTSLDSGLNANYIDHVFLDVNEDMEANQAMHDKMAEAYPGEQVLIPVVDVNGVILRQPSVLQVKKYLWENQETN